EWFSSLALLSSGTIALAWEDRWLSERPQAHVIYSQDQGLSWAYSSLGVSNPYLALAGDGRLLALNDGYFMETLDLRGVWHKSPFHVEWPTHFDKERVALLRHVTFVSEDLGYALVVHWPTGMIPEIPTEVGFVMTEDGGANWQHLQ